MEVKKIRVYYGAYRVLKVKDGWYRAPRRVGGVPKLILRLLLQNKRQVIVRADQVDGAMDLWYEFINTRRVCSESESSSEDSGDDDDNAKGCGGDDHGEDKKPSSEEELTDDDDDGEKPGCSDVKDNVDEKELEKTLDVAEVSVVLDRLPTQFPRKVYGNKKIPPNPKPKRPTTMTKNIKKSLPTASTSLFDFSSPAPRTPGSSPQKKEDLCYDCTFTGCKQKFVTAAGVMSHFTMVHEKPKRVNCDHCAKEYSYSNLASHKKRCKHNPLNKRPLK